MSARTLGEDVRATAARTPGAEAIVAGDRRLTYAELDRAADAAAAALLERGVTRGDRVALVMANSADTAIALYGVLRAGAAISPLNPSIKADRLGYVLANSGAAAVVHDEDLGELVLDACARGGVTPAKLTAADFAGDHAEAPPTSVDLAAVIYTSGSTGDPKGVTLTHRNMTFAADSIIEYLGMRADDRVLCVSPLSFDYGLYQLLMCVRLGATLVLERGFMFVGRVVQLLEGERITGLPGVPTLFQILTGVSGLAERELPHLRYLTNTGAALPVPTIEALRLTFPQVEIFSMYGLTECKRVSYLPPADVDRKPGSVGIAIPGTEAWVDAHGELLVRGDHVMQGYWGDPELTAQRLRPGRWPWERVLATGDLFRADDEGYLYFLGRRDDLIKSRGEKVVPKEVEEVLHAAAGVREAAVVGVPDKLLGSAVHAHVSPQPGHELDPVALRRHCAERLEDHKVPQRFVVHAELPRTPNGKIDKTGLRRA